MSKRTIETCTFKSDGEYNDAHIEIVSSRGIHRVKVNGEELPYVTDVVIYFRPREMARIVIESLVVEEMVK